MHFVLYILDATLSTCGDILMQTNVGCLLNDLGGTSVRIKWLD